MKPLRQLYLGIFLVSCVGLAFLLFPQHINALRIPNLFGTLAAGSIIPIITQIIRSRKEEITFPRLIPAILVVPVYLSHVVALFLVGGTPVTGGSAAFLFYLITTLVNAVFSAVGFFLK